MKKNIDKIDKKTLNEVDIEGTPYHSGNRCELGTPTAWGQSLTLKFTSMILIPFLH